MIKAATLFRSSTRASAIVAVGALLAAGEIAAAADKFPTRPIRMITTMPGTGTNLAARLIAQELTSRLGWKVVVDNRGIVAVDIVAKAAKDGQTLLVYTSPMWLLPFMRENVPWDPVKDFAPISLTNQQPSVLVLHPSVPANSVSKLIALAKAKPGQLNYGSGSPGAPTHLSAELFASMAGISLVRVSYKGGGEAIIALLGGQLQMVFGVPAAVMPQVHAGKLKALAVSSAEPTQLAPGLPTMAASGLPGYESNSLAGMFAPAGTPGDIVNLLSQETQRIINRPETKNQLLAAGVEGVSCSPQKFAAVLKADMAKWGKVIRNAGIHE